MSKGYKNRYKKNGHERSEPLETERPFIMTEDGRTVFVKSISMLEMEEAERGLEKFFRDQGEPLDVPTYTVEVVGGGEVPYPLKPEVLEVEDPEETGRRKAAWEAHQDAVARFEAEKGRIMQEIILEGIDIEMPDDGVWEARMRRRYIEIPEDPVLKRQKYILTEVLKTPDDWLNAQNEILIVSSSGAIDREAVEAASATFRSQLFAITEKGSSTDGDGGSGEEEEAVEVAALDDSE